MEFACTIDADLGLYDMLELRKFPNKFGPAFDVVVSEKSICIDLQGIADGAVRR